MGYILPVTQHQYNDYQKRTIQTKRSPFVLEKVYKATLEHRLKQQQHHSNEQERKLYTPQGIHVGKYPKPQVQEKFYSQVTGKGGYFSETI